MANPLKMLKLKPIGIQFIQELPINAPPRKVWDSILDPGHWFFWSEERSQWPKHTLEARPGGRWIIEEEDGTASLFATITHVEPEKLLRLAGAMGMNHLPVSSAFIFELQPKKDGRATLLRTGTRMFGYMEKDVKKRFQGGWKQLFPKLKALAEGK